MVWKRSSQHLPGGGAASTVNLSHSGALQSGRGQVQARGLSGLKCRGRFTVCKPTLLTCYGAVALTVLTACAPRPPATVPPTTTSGDSKIGEVAQNAGIPKGIRLRASSSLILDKAGTVIDGLDIAGCVLVAADSVTIKNSRIRCDHSPNFRAVSAQGSPRGTVIENSEIDGMGTTDIAVELNDASIVSNDIHSTNDGIRVGQNVMVSGNRIHEMVTLRDLHADGIQGVSAKNVQILENYIDPRRTSGSKGDRSTQSHNNSAIQLGSELGDRRSRDVTISGNYLNGGACTLNIRSDIDAENMSIDHNLFGPDSEFKCAALIPASISLGIGNLQLPGQTPVVTQIAESG